MSYVSAFVFGLLLGASAIGGAVWLFPKIGLLDYPERYNLQRAKLPYPGGIVFALLWSVMVYFHPEFIVLIPAVGLVGIVSFLDDRHPLPAWLRMGIYIAAAAMVYYLGVRISFIGDPFHETNFELGQWPLLSFVITVLWIVALQNALNWFDGLPGLAVGVSGVGFLALGVLGLVRPELFYDTEHMPLTLANLYMGGLCIGGLLFFLRGKILLGDTGSQVLGFLLAVLAIFSGAKIATTLLVLGVPILDFGFVIVRRVILEHRAPWKGDLRHLHHNLSRRIGVQKTVLVLIGLSALLGGISVLCSGMTKLFALIGAVCVIIGLRWWAGQKSQRET